MTLPEGWTIKTKEEESPLQKQLPEGWTVAKKKTPKQRDEEKLAKASGSYHVPKISNEELEQMSPADRYDYLKRAEMEGSMLAYNQLFKGALSGLTFGATEYFDALKPLELETTSPWSIASTTGEIGGSLIPISGIVKAVELPAAKLAAKSPVFQRQISSLLTMMGSGMAVKAVEEIAKGEMPNAEDVLEHGYDWVLLDVALQTMGATGKFAAGLFKRARSIGVPRKEVVNQISKGIAESGVDLTNAEAVSQKALELLEQPVTEAEMNAARRLKLKTKELTEAEMLAQETLKEQPITSADLKSKKITDEPVNRLTQETIPLAEPIPLQVKSFTQEAEALAKDSIQEQIDTIGVRAASEEELGNTIREDIERNLEARKEEYRPLYREAEEAAQHETHVPQKAAQEAGNKLLRMNRLATKPAGYSNVLKTLENVLEDAGFVIQRNEQGAIEHILSNKEVPVSDTIELARRLNEIVDYEAVEPSVKDALKSVVRAAKQDIRDGLAANPDALAAFELAEQSHAATASRFTRENIRKIRGQQAGEKIAKLSENPSAMGDLKEVLTDKQYLNLEREMLEKLNTQNYEKSRKTLKELEKHLSAENKKLAREIVESKNPHNPLARKKLTQDAILNDMSNALTTGTRPEKTLSLWKNPKGQQLVTDTFHGSPNWPQVKNYLEKQSFNDMVSSVLKDGKLDLKKLKHFMDDPAVIKNIRDQGGQEAVQFFKSLDTQVKQLEKNVQLLERLPQKKDIARGKELLKRIKEKAKEKPRIAKIGEEAIETTRARGKETTGHRGSKILERMAEKDFPLQAKAKKWKKEFEDIMGIKPKGALTVFGFMKLGLPNAAATLIGFRMFNKLLLNPRLRRAFKEASKHHTDPLSFILAVENLSEAFDETSE